MTVLYAHEIAASLALLAMTVLYAHEIAASPALLAITRNPSRA
jgi:hypothetical protein